MGEPNGGGGAGNAARPADHKTGRYSMLYRDGARVEVGDPVETSTGIAEPQWLCAAKLVGPKKDRPAAYDDADAEGTQTLLVRTGRGTTPEEAQRDALNQLALVYGTPNAPPPSVVITKKPSEPPPRLLEAAPPATGFWNWLTKLFTR